MSDFISWLWTLLLKAYISLLTGTSIGVPSYVFIQMQHIWPNVQRNLQKLMQIISGLHLCHAPLCEYWFIRTNTKSPFGCHQTTAGKKNEQQDDVIWILMERSPFLCLLHVLIWETSHPLHCSSIWSNTNFTLLIPLSVLAGCKTEWDNIGCWLRAEAGQVVNISCSEVFQHYSSNQGWFPAQSQS